METDGSPACLNCGAPIEGSFCSSCGQQYAEHRQSLKQFLLEAFSEYFGVDGRFWTTSKALLFHPGRLTKAWLAGQRTKYLRPLRIYLLATVSFFFVLSVIDPLSSLERAVENFTAPDTLVTAGSHIASLESSLEKNQSRFEGLLVEADSLQVLYDAARQSYLSDSSAGSLAELDFEDRQEELDELLDDLDDAREKVDERRKKIQVEELRYLLQRQILSTLPPDSLVRPSDYQEIASIAYPYDNINVNLPSWAQGNSVDRLKSARSTNEKMRAFSDLGRSVIERLPLAIFLMLPIFALILKIVYIRRDYYYVEHLVFGLHTHAFAFTMFFVATVLSYLLGKLDGIQGEGLVIPIAMAIVGVYYIVATKVVYQQGWIKTLMKIFLISSIYNLVLLLAAVLAIILAAMLG